MAAVVVLTGCGGRVAPPAADAGPVEVLRVFLDAVVAYDRSTGKKIAGDCWPQVKDWFHRYPGWPLIKNDAHMSKYETRETTLEGPVATGTDARVFFRFWRESGEEEEAMLGELRRDDESSPWRVCDIKYDFA